MAREATTAPTPTETSVDPCAITGLVRMDRGWFQCVSPATLSDGDDHDLDGQEDADEDRSDVDAQHGQDGDHRHGDGRGQVDRDGGVQRVQVGAHPQGDAGRQEHPLGDVVDQGVFLPASIALGVGAYLPRVSPGVPVNPVFLRPRHGGGRRCPAVLRIHVEANARRLPGPSSIRGHRRAERRPVSRTGTSPCPILPFLVIGEGSTPLRPLSVVASLAITMFSVNGYDSAINFSEETRGAPGNIGKAVVIAACRARLFFGSFIAGLFGAQNLQTYLSSPTPLLDLCGTV